MSHHVRKGSAQRLDIDEIAKICRWTQENAQRFMGEMLRQVPAPGEPMTVTRAALERWLVRNCERAVAPG